MKDMDAVELKRVLNPIPEFMEATHQRIRTPYNKEADVLYHNFKKPGHADDFELTDDNILIRYENRAVIGITMLNASRRMAE
ncbi:MAG: DUF2283 domain-containing protein [Euryarchaeota archaeon]|nr:MAG: hypothetical protein C5S47_05800 [ANME-2 cluster archaeon]MEA1866042.1 DUF2283 domain-containing protein [Euryarchaeota archaeon]